MHVEPSSKAADGAFMGVLSIIACGRVCGSCTACCVTLPIPAGQVSVAAKPAGVACPHVCEGRGCNAYVDRPATCRNFRCAWLGDESWPAAWRPNESGLLCLRETLDERVPAAVAYEVRLDALLTSVAAEIVAELLRTTAVLVIVTFNERRLRIAGRWRCDAPESTAPRPHFAVRTDEPRKLPPQVPLPPTHDPIDDVVRTSLDLFVDPAHVLADHA